MATSFTVKQLPKTDGSLTRSPNFHKYYIKCSGRITPETPTSEPWLHVLRLIKTDISDIDKSRILLGSLQKYGEIVVKIGDSESMHYEYTNSTRVHSFRPTDIQNEHLRCSSLYDLSASLAHDTIKNGHTEGMPVFNVHGPEGFVKYICYFSCEDDFRSIPSPSRFSICKGPGESMGVILMPYFELGSLAKFVWSNALAHVFQSSLKHAFLSIVILFQKSNLIHGDFHPGNVLLKRTKQSEVLYAVPGVGEFSIKTFGLRTWIMDFENMRYAEYSPAFAVIKSFNDFYYDIQKFFMLLYNTIKNLDQRTISPIVSYLSKKSIDSNYLTKSDIDAIFAYIDAIKFIY